MLEIDGILDVSGILEISVTATQSIDGESDQKHSDSGTRAADPNMTIPQRRIDAAGIAASIEQLQECFGKDDVALLVAVLEAMKRNPQDGALIDQLSQAFDGLGIMQGAVLTCAPYLAVILSDFCFDDFD